MSLPLFTKISEAVNKNTFLKLTLTAPKRVVRVIASPKLVSYQLSEKKGAQEFHTNFNVENFLLWCEAATFKEAVLFTTEGDYHLNPKGKVRKTPPSLKQPLKEHNRKKLHLVDAPPYFQALGVKQDKVKQIEKFLREVKAELPYFKDKKKLSIADFGCGKAYLTFALYDFLSQEFEVKLTGIDLKADVMKNCQELADKLGYHGLKFINGRIEDFPDEPLDMAVALHACDTATDAAIARAVKLKAGVILAAPCCQHELYEQIQSDVLSPLLKHGILKERVAALATDAARGAILETIGYHVKIVEFIDAAHTPKNLLLRAHFTGVKKDRSQYNLFKNCINISPLLENLVQ